MPSRPITLRALALTGAATLALAGCREDAAPQARQEPLFVPAATAQAYGLPIAPTWQELPAAPPAPTRVVARDQGYSYAERAYALDNAFYEAPPDYGFAYDDAQPWAWRTEDDYQMYAEPIDGGFRYYYYEPGADYPYFVRDPDYGYGYAPGGVLVTIYNSTGVLLPPVYVHEYAERAGRYRVRARNLRQAAYREPRVAVAQEAWLSRRPTFVASQHRWMEAATRQKDWREYRERRHGQDVNRFMPERERRIQAVQRSDREEVRQAIARREERDDRRIPGFDRGRVERVDRRDDSRADQAQRARLERAQRGQAEQAQQARAAERAQSDRRRDDDRREAFERNRGQQVQAERQRGERMARAETARAERPDRPNRMASLQADGERRRAEAGAREARQEQARQEQDRRGQMQRARDEQARQGQARDEQMRQQRQARDEQMRARRDGGGRAEQAQRAERRQRAEQPQQQRAERPERRAEAAAARPEREARAPQERQRPDRAEDRSGGGGHGGGRQMRHD